MSRFFGFFIRSEAGRDRAAHWQEVARARLGPPLHSDGRMWLWAEPGAGVDSREAPGLGFVTASGTVHNRDEVVRALGIGPITGGDRAILRHAFARWGEKACGRIHGDWRAAAWNPDRQELLLARDPYGNSAVYHQSSPDIFAFGTSQDDLRALELAPPVLDELYLGQLLISWSAYHGERTVDRSVSRLPPAHVLRVTAGGIDKTCYWRPEDAPPTRLPRREDYVERFRELFDQAVRQRLPVEGRVATALSSGLDSGSVAVTAAPLLAQSGRRLSAYVSAPVSNADAFVGSGIADEYPLAAASAAAGRTIDLHRVEADRVSPIAALRDMLSIVRAPEHSAGGMYWLLEIFRTAARDGNGTVLTGQMGNAGVSWGGDPTSFPLRWQIAMFGLPYMAKLRFRRLLPWPLERRYRRLRRGQSFASSAIRPEFASRLRLAERMDDDPLSGPYRRARQQRLVSLKPGSLKVGAFYAEIGAATGVQITDPTADPRLLEFCLTIPDALFVDPVTGIHRALIREAMKGRLPDAVRLNTALGRQSSDLVHRLRRHAEEVEAALDEIEAGAGADYVDVPRMRQVWERIRIEDSQETLSLAITHTTRGIMAGLFANGFGTRY